MKHGTAKAHVPRAPWSLQAIHTLHSRSRVQKADYMTSFATPPQVYGGMRQCRCGVNGNHSSVLTQSPGTPTNDKLTGGHLANTHSRRLLTTHAC
jgi:hypothetical protein